MPALFVSWIETLFRYLETRFPARVFAPCAAFLLVAGIAGGATTDAAAAALAVVLAFGLLLQFRLMDDLADRDRDRWTHPTRLLPQARSLVPFRALLALIFVLNLGVLYARPASGPHLAVFLALTVFYCFWYTFAQPRLSGTLFGYHVVVVKYPFFVYLTSAGEAQLTRLLPTMALVYLCFAIYEALHDEELRALTAAATVLRVEAWVLFAVTLAMAAELSRSGPALALAQGLFACASLVLLNRLIGGRRRGTWPAATSYLVFAIGLTLSLVYSIGGIR